LDTWYSQPLLCSPLKKSKPCDWWQKSPSSFSECRMVWMLPMSMNKMRACARRMRAVREPLESR
jgi:hypothetical protein